MNVAWADLKMPSFLLDLGIFGLAMQHDKEEARAGDAQPVTGARVLHISADRQGFGFVC